MISDLHLGSRLQRGVLPHPEPLARLLAALSGGDRLILLGDVVELGEGRPARSLRIAEPVLRALGRRVGTQGEIVLVPGNHDLGLVRAWVRARADELRVETQLPADASPVLARVTELLAPARVRVSYPGVWVAEGVWATHGHYLDRHLLPSSTFGVLRGLLGRQPGEASTPADYELAGGPSVTRLETRLTSALPQPLATLVEAAAELARAASMPSAPRLLAPSMSPLTARVLGLQMRRVSIPALARVVHNLEIDARWVLFGHVHRLGPLAADRPEDWQAPGGRTRIANTGSWVYEPLLLHRARPPHPYWPGGGLRIEETGEPRAVSLLDDLDVAALTGSR